MKHGISMDEGWLTKKKKKESRHDFPNLFENGFIFQH